ncbi:MAG: glycosyltransferase [Bacteroidota bacterium]|nr:glycosyltransferase [Bacteroidota bacterium]
MGPTAHNKPTCCVAITNNYKYDQRVQKVVRYLVSLGYHINVIGRNFPVLSQENIDAIHSDLHDSVSIDLLSLKYSQGWRFYLEYNWKLWRHIRKQHYDVYLANDLDTILGVYHGSMRHAKRIFDAHEWFEEVDELQTKPFVRWVWKTIANRYIPKFTYCYTVNQWLADTFSRAYSKDFAVVRNIPASRDIEESLPLALQEALPKKFILYQGVINSGRGLDKVISAWRKDLPHLVIAGYGDEVDQLKRLAHQQGKSDQIIWLGRITPNLLPSITQKAQLGLHLLDIASKNYRYSLANKCFEYMHAGIPMLTVNTPIHEMLYEKAPYFLMLDDLHPEQIVQGIQRCLSAESQQVMRQAAHKAKENFTWTNECKQLEAMYGL